MCSRNSNSSLILVCSFIGWRTKCNVVSYTYSRSNPKLKNCFIHLEAILFLCFVGEGRASKEKLYKEYIDFGDVVQESFKEHYKNLTLKTQGKSVTHFDKFLWNVRSFLSDRSWQERFQFFLTTSKNKSTMISLKFCRWGWKWSFEKIYKNSSKLQNSTPSSKGTLLRVNHHRSHYSLTSPNWKELEFSPTLCRSIEMGHLFLPQRSLRYACRWWRICWRQENCWTFIDH